MKRKTEQERLFEVMGRLDKTFKPKLNENYSDYLDTHYSADGMDDYHADNATQTKAEVLYDKGLELFNAGDVDGAEKLRQEALRISSRLGWDENELPPYDGLNEENGGNPQLPPELSNSEEAQEIQNKLNDVDVSSSALLGVIDKLTDLSPEEKNELSGLLNRVLKITGDQIPKFYNDTDAIDEDASQSVMSMLEKVFDSISGNVGIWRGDKFRITPRDENEAIIEGNRGTDIMGLKYHIKDNFGEDKIENEERDSFSVVTQTNFPRLF